MIKALGYSQTLFDPTNPGRLCRGRERWVEAYPLDEPPALERLVISGAAFSDDTARDAKRGLRFSGLDHGELLELLFPGQALLAFCEQGLLDAVPEGAILVESHQQPRDGGRRMDVCVRWRVPVSGAQGIAALVSDGPGAADGFIPWQGELSDSLEEALFLLTGQGDRIDFPVRSYQPSAIPVVLEHVPWLALVHLDKHSPALSIYTRENPGLEAVLARIGEGGDTLSVPFSIPPMLARWDRALYELRQRWSQDREFPVPPGETRPPAYERRKQRSASEE
jgi:hypothetical protein